MANHKQAEKRSRQNEKRRLRNRALNSKIKTSVKKFMAVITSGDAEKAKELLPKVVKEVMQAGAKGLFHSNKIARKISQLQKAVNSLNK